MAAFTVLINGRYQSVSFQEGESLLAVLQREGFSVNAPCGGKGRCGNCTVTLQMEDGTKTVLACKTPAVEGCTVMLAEGSDDLSWNVTESRSIGTSITAAGLGAAVDLGTTSIAVSVFDLATGEKLGMSGAWNEQRSYGADVITRISYTMEHPDGLNRLSR